ncbi:MAG TPA: acyl-CoA dehydrogenase [Spongiibacteraceae bacterium]|nr:acyl-CoA dehydrogenase [Spongiibacteraceae bacterium]HCS28837.1 acyl-CoA dehydrogenase [Spongiibacteraceae bacterium]
MDAHSSLEQDENFRQEVHNWLLANCPPSQRWPITAAEQVWGGRNRTFPSEDARLWFERMQGKGWTVPDWPREYGGAGLSERQTRILEQELKRLRCRKPLYDLGIWMLGPALLEFGSETQKREHLPRIAAGEVRWCQGYSEPGAGSDLASLQMRADDCGDHFLVNGSKIWTTKADLADWIFCLVRTRQGGIKQQGISFLLIDMDNPGVSVSPISLISGESEFCQTFFDNVKVPKHNLVGKLHEGWSVAKALLKHERKLMSEVEIDTPGPSFTLHEAADNYIGRNSDGKLADLSLRDALVKNDMRFKALALTHGRSYEEKQAGIANAIAMIMKYAGTEAQKQKEEVLLAILGTQALGWESRGEEGDFNSDELLTARGWLYSKILSIAGGSTEVQLNIIAKRILELPD